LSNMRKSPTREKHRQKISRFNADLAESKSLGIELRQRVHPPLAPSIVFGNGRLDADEINIDTKYAGRILEILEHVHNWRR
jgi:hypothetical protein